MFENYLFTEGSAHNTVEDGKVTGFELETLIPYYRGIPLSMVHDVDLVIDGTPIPRQELAISPNGEDWFTWAEVETVVSYRWEYGTPLHVRWQRVGGLAPGEHEVTLKLKVKPAYYPVPAGGERTRRVLI